MSLFNFSHVECEQCGTKSVDLRAFDNCPPDHRTFSVSMTGERTPLNIPPLLSQFPAIKKALEKAVVAAIGVPPATFGEARTFSHYKCDSCGAEWRSVSSDACPICGQELKAVFIPYNAVMPTKPLTVADLLKAKAKLDEAAKAHATPCCICGALSYRTVCADCRIALAQQAEAAMKNPPPPKGTTPLAVMDALKKGEISAAKALSQMRELLVREKAAKQTPKPPEPEQPKKLRKLRVEE